MSIKEQYFGFLNSKPLWKSDALNLGFSQFEFEKESNNTILANHIIIDIKDNEVLGKRIEHFFEYLINCSKRYQLVSKNLQVFKDKTTIGELDFLLKDLQKEKTIHIELVYKFYIYDPDIKDELSRWIGPNRKDSLLQKFEKLKNKQLPLLYKSETELILEELQLKSKDIEQKVCYLSNLFVPVSYIGKTIPIINNTCIVGFWIKKIEFTQEKYSTYRFNIPQKKNWVIAPKYCNTWLTFDEIKESLELSILQKKSPLLWMKSNEDLYHRFFITWW